MPSEVRRGTVRIEMCEAHRARPRPAGYVTYGAQRCLLHFFLEIQITVPRDATFHCVAHHAARNRMFAQIGATQEFVTPITGSAMALGIFKSKRTASHVPPWSPQISSARFIQGSREWSADSKVN